MSLSIRHSRRATILGASLLMLSGIGAARAEPGATTWTTYLYEGPGAHFRVVGEVDQMQAVEILGCADQWCRISYDDQSGYVHAEVVVRAGEDAARPPAGVLAQPAAALEPAPKGPCFVANQKGGNGGNELTSFCQK